MVQEAYVQGISTRSVDDLVKATGMSGVSKSQVSRLCAEFDERVQAFLERPIEGEWPYPWIDATYAKTREAVRIVSFDPAWPTRRQARHQRRARRPEGRGRQSVEVDLAARVRHFQSG